MKLRGTLPRGIGRDLFGPRATPRGAPAANGTGSEKTTTRSLATRPSGATGGQKGTRGQ